MKDIKKDFESFSLNEEVAPTSPLAKVKSQIAAQAPKMRSVAVKLGLIHLGSSFLTLLACPQFGLRLFFEGHGLMHYFMQISETFCYSFCGAFYLASTFVIARFVLNYDEWLLVKKSRTLMIGSIAMISLGIFTMLSAEMSWQLALVWLFGATLGAELVSLSKNEWRKFKESLFGPAIPRS
ncbi:hypothetical protein D3C72_1604390 [compost metagenome]